MTKQNLINIFYFDRPELYEAVQGSKSRYKEESRFLTDIFQRKGGIDKVLDVGCGTGLHLDCLRKEGIEGVGIDLNQNMVQYARENYLGINFEVADMRQLKYKNEFDALFSLCTTFCWNRTNEEIVEALQSFHRSVRMGGLAIIETFNPIVFISDKQFKKSVIKKEPYNKFGFYCTLDHRVDNKEQRMYEKRTIRNIEDDSIVQEDNLEYRLFFPQEMRYFLETNGFEVLSQHSSFNVRDVSLDKFRLISVAQKV